MTRSDTERSAAEPTEAVVLSAPARVVLPRCLALAGPRDADDPGSPSVVRVVPRERLVSRRVYVAVDAAGWAVYVGSSADEMRRIHEHEDRLRAAVPDVGALTWCWFPALAEPYLAEEALIRLLQPTAQRTRRGRDGRALAPTAGQLAALRAAGLHV